jgi:hypothetical protein
LGLDGNPGSGLDVDQDSSTCAPEGKCSQGIDNQLSMLAGFLNSNLEKEVNNGGLILLAELSNVKTDGTPFTFALYAGKKASSCDHSQGGCDYLADDSTLTEDCEPLITLDNATIVNGKFTAGGPGYQFTLQVPLFGDNYLDIVLFNGTVIADIVLDGDQVVSVSNGVIGGAVPKSVFVTALEYVDPDDLPAPKATIVQLIDLIIKNDIDTGPPVGPDAASIGLLFEAVQGAIVGVD